jgi:ABC-2 type transport system permease protein
MHLRPILAIARKDALDILLNKTTLVLLATPIMLAVLFAVIGGLIGTKTNNILAYDPSGSGVEQVLGTAFAHPRITYASSPDAVSAAFGQDGAHRSSPYALGIVLPANFEASLRAGQRPQISLYFNGDELSIQDRALLLRAVTDYARTVASPQPPIAITAATINPPSASPAVDITMFYALAAVLSSLLVGTSLLPGMLIEEKEKKTLRVLMVSPASWGDIVVGKLLVGLGYQLVLAGVVLGLTHGFVGQVPLVLLFTALGSCFSVALGALLGTLFKTTSAAGAASGMLSFLYVVPVFAVGTFGQLLQGSPLVQLVRALPTYYLADGTYNALHTPGASVGMALDEAIMLGSVVALIVLAAWALRRQAAVAATI